MAYYGQDHRSASADISELQEGKALAPDRHIYYNIKVREKIVKIRPFVKVFTFTLHCTKRFAAIKFLWKDCGIFALIRK